MPQIFRDDLYEKASNGGITIGYFDELPMFGTTKAVKRAILIAKNALEQRGFKLVPFSISLDDLNMIRDIVLGLVGHHIFAPAIKGLNQNYEQPKLFFNVLILF
jgi:hypothetical protein